MRTICKNKIVFKLMNSIELNRVTLAVHRRCWKYYIQFYFYKYISNNAIIITSQQWHHIVPSLVHWNEQKIYDNRQGEKKVSCLLREITANVAYWRYTEIFYNFFFFSNDWMISLNGQSPVGAQQRLRSHFCLIITYTLLRFYCCCRHLCDNSCKSDIIWCFHFPQK